MFGESSHHTRCIPAKSRGVFAVRQPVECGNRVEATCAEKHNPSLPQPGSFEPMDRAGEIIVEQVAGRLSYSHLNRRLGRAVHQQVEVWQAFEILRAADVTVTETRSHGLQLYMAQQPTRSGTLLHQGRSFDFPIVNPGHQTSLAVFAVCFFPARLVSANLCRWTPGTVEQIDYPSARPSQSPLKPLWYSRPATRQLPGLHKPCYLLE